MAAGFSPGTKVVDLWNDKCMVRAYDVFQKICVLQFFKRFTEIYRNLFKYIFNYTILDKNKEYEQKITGFRFDVTIISSVNIVMMIISNRTVQNVDDDLGRRNLARDAGIVAAILEGRPRYQQIAGYPVLGFFDLQRHAPPAIKRIFSIGAREKK